jgi:hypothetical protein
MDFKYFDKKYKKIVENFLIKIKATFKFCFFLTSTSGKIRARGVLYQPPSFAVKYPLGAPIRTYVG